MQHIVYVNDTYSIQYYQFYSIYFCYIIFYIFPSGNNRNNKILLMNVNVYLISLDKYSHNKYTVYKYKKMALYIIK